MHVCSTIYVLQFLIVEILKNVSSFTITETTPDDFVAWLVDPVTCYFTLHTL